jgi:uncharacterized protein YjiS (DUF1127 family)
MTAEPLSGSAAKQDRLRLHQAILRLLIRWCARRNQRLDLAELDDHQLADIGLTREEARRESSVPFWR